MTQEKEGRTWGVWLVWLDCIRRRPWLQFRPSGDGGRQGRPDSLRETRGWVGSFVRTNTHLGGFRRPESPLFFSP
jgi:hypothetical protein